jgi:hypothetical protein
MSELRAVRCPCGQSRHTPCRALVCRAFRPVYVPIDVDSWEASEDHARRREDGIVAEARDILARRRRLRVRVTAGADLR